ncbi:MAG: hypothetical protein ACTHM2_19350 [Afipia sp.]
MLKDREWGPTDWPAMIVEPTLSQRLVGEARRGDVAGRIDLRAVRHRWSQSLWGVQKNVVGMSHYGGSRGQRALIAPKRLKRQQLLGFFAFRFRGGPAN